MRDLGEKLRRTTGSSARPGRMPRMSDTVSTSSTATARAHTIADFTASCALAKPGRVSTVGAGGQEQAGCHQQADGDSGGEIGDQARDR